MKAKMPATSHNSVFYMIIKPKTQENFTCF